MELTIEKLVYGGDGLARIEEHDGRRKIVFVPRVLPGERVEATLVEDHGGFARARLDRIIGSSPERTSPPCPYFGECGGCHYQHASYESQLTLKEQILRETVSRIAKVDLPKINVHASHPLQYRNRTRLKLAPAASGQTSFSIGYHKLASHQLLPVRECPISSALINRAIQALWTLATTHSLPIGLAEVELFADDADRQLLVEFLVERSADRDQLISLAKSLQELVPELSGVTVLPRTQRKDELVAAPELDNSTDKKAAHLLGSPFLTYKVADGSYKVSAGSFFQTNRHVAAKLVDLVCRDARGRLAIDLYAGVGLFTLPLAKAFERVIGVEIAPSSVADLRANAPPHVRVVESTTEAFLARASQRPDLVVVDPPRSGLGKKVSAGIADLSPQKLTYVSCDPSTMARDLSALIASGYRITNAHLIDLFPQTFHIETVITMAR